MEVDQLVTIQNTYFVLIDVIKLIFFLNLIAFGEKKKEKNNFLALSIKEFVSICVGLKMVDYQPD